MPEITESYISSLAPDASSCANGRSLASKGSFIKLARDAEDSLLFGECAGSGSKPYSVSVDFSNPSSPVFRCSCPSRKLPCKHGIGLLFARVQGKEFAVEPIPDDIFTKRAKIKAKEEKKEEQTASPEKSPGKAKKSAAAKKSAQAGKIKAQLGGLDLAEKALFSIIRDGFGSLTPKAAAALDTQARQLGDAYLPGVQAAFRELLQIFEDDLDDNAALEERYAMAFESAVRLSFLIRKGRDYLDRKLADPNLARDAASEMESQLGHAWQLTELDALGLAEKNARLMQLAFTCHKNEASKSFEDTGVWLNLGSGRILRSLNLRPFKAAGHIAEDDSIFGILETPALYVYPGAMNPRARWDCFRLKEAAREDYQTLCGHAAQDLSALIKAVKDNIKNPLAEANPFALLRYARIGKIGDDAALESHGGQRLLLVDADGGGWPPTIPALEALGGAVALYDTALLRFAYRPEIGDIVAAPLALASGIGLCRLSF